MADLKAKYGTGGQTITITLASLANNGARESTVIDNSSNLFVDALVQLQIRTGSSGVSATGSVNIYAYATVDGGTTYTDPATGSNAGVTLPAADLRNVKLIGVMYLIANSTTYKSAPLSVAQAFGGILPEKWGIIIENKTGAALSGTEGDHAKLYQGVLGQSV